MMEAQPPSEDPLVSDHLKWIYEHLPERFRVQEEERLWQLYLETGAKLVAINQVRREYEPAVPTQDT